MCQILFFMIEILRLMIINMVYSTAGLISVVITLRHLDQETIVHFVWLDFSYMFTAVFSQYSSIISALLLSLREMSFLFCVANFTHHSPLAVSLALGAFLTSSPYVHLDTSAFNMLFFVYGYMSFIMILELFFFVNASTKFITRDIEQKMGKRNG